MTDTMTSEQRHRCMSRIRAKDTKPEMIVRRFLWEYGFRYRLHVKRLPGSPDIVMRKHKIAIFVNGCFWHGHNTRQLENGDIGDSDCCRIPHTNRQFWLTKIQRNISRDMANVYVLERLGWRVITIWECDLRQSNRQATLDRLLVTLNRMIHPRVKYAEYEEDIAQAAEPESTYEITDKNK